MGGGSYTDKDWKSFSTTRKYDDPKTTTKDIYNKSKIDEALDPKKFSIRESLDGPDNPQATPIIIGLDVTGSMDPVLDAMARKGMKTVCQEIYDRKPVTDPHICTLGIGDVEWDRYPFQATQFEADIRIFEQLEKIYLEEGGGGNDHESYILAWYFATHRVKADSFAKRGQKGFIFTIGDEEITPIITHQHFKEHLNDGQMDDMGCRELYDLTFPEWEIFHVIVKEGHHARSHFGQVSKSWQDVIGAQRTIPLDDHTKIGEVIVSILEIAAGKEHGKVINSWDGSTAVTVDNALKSVLLNSGYSPVSLDQAL